jgi:cytochrome c biogenesis protein CcdA
MIFTHVARIVAVLAFVLGFCTVLLGLGIATDYAGPYEVELKRYAAVASAGEVIVRGSLVAVLALALGTLAEISFSARRRASREW